MASKPRPSTRSSNPKTTKDLGGEGLGTHPRKTRARRDDTSEAISQRKHAPKTHPTRAPGAQRKDNARGRAADPMRRGTRP